MSTQTTQKTVVSYLNRVVAVAAGAVALGGAIVPIVANADLSSTAGIEAGVAGVVAVAWKFLQGWQNHEARVFYGHTERLPL